MFPEANNQKKKKMYLPDFQTEHLGIESMMLCGKAEVPDRRSKAGGRAEAASVKDGDRDLSSYEAKGENVLG